MSITSAFWQFVLAVILIIALELGTLVPRLDSLLNIERNVLTFFFFGSFKSGFNELNELFGCCNNCSPYTGCISIATVVFGAALNSSLSFRHKRQEFSRA